MDTDRKADDPRDRSFDDEVLKGDIVVGAIAGEEARQATAQEHSLTFKQAVRLYPKAIGCKMLSHSKSSDIMLITRNIYQGASSSLWA